VRHVDVMQIFLLELRGAEKFGTKTEVKNLNSFRNVQKALEYEIERQIDMLEQSQINSSRNKTMGRCQTPNTRDAIKRNGS